ncbi:hypothetical protein R3W88_009776 [Solanum pinnatisectum]|uniref:Uncharacterized protein n=1 Tax=Solanum pinnatisectum TaxID=50273 RepID=A0AAV9MFC1_9SOLN|nr:hypothetical protein R3W88_009776 [Solanum pinnatisectum]
MLHAFAKICQTTLPSKYSIKFPSGYGNNWEKEVESGKTRYLHVEEALSLSLGIKKYECPRKKIVSSRVLSTKSKTIETRGNLSKPRTQISDAFPEKRTVQRSLESTGYMKPRNFPNFRKLNRA